MKMYLRIILKLKVVLTSINNENVLTSINNENVFEDYIKVESCINIH